MRIVRTISECRAACESLRPLGLVPTMGALHEGHLSLVRAARSQDLKVAVSIFVNPTQFAPQEDFSRYPRPIEQDLALCESAGVDLVFNPEPAEMYPPGSPAIRIDLPELASTLEGAHRPGHFSGVCQVVAKLFNIFQPQRAFFGQKDAQQLRIIRGMVEALDFPIRIVACPTVREADGLAMSSRNRYLSPDERRRALAISRALFAAAEEVRRGVDQANRVLSTLRRIILEPHLSIDYVAAVDPATFKPVERITGPTLLLAAARVGHTRLIDNVLVEPPNVGSG